MKSPRSFRFAFTLAWLVFTTVLAAGQPSVPGTTASPWNRVVVIGASASAGFVMDEPMGGPETVNCKLCYYLDAAIAAPHQPLQDFSTALMFLNPDAVGPQQLESAVAAKPTLVIGVDFLFWSCYGNGLTDAGRMRRFEAGLKLLDKVRCPLVVGDIPDASAATNTGIISPDMLADAAVRSAANARLKAWAATRPRVAVVRLAHFMRAIASNQALTVHNRKYPAGKTRRFMQNDELHPTPSGAALLALGILDALVKRDPEFRAQDVRWSQSDVFRRGYASAQADP